MMKRFYLLMLLSLVLMSLPLSLQAQGEPEIQEFYSVVSPEINFVYFDLFGMEAGTTIYLYAESDDIDTYIGICDLACEEQFIDNDDIADDNLNSALEYTFAASGDYSIFVASCCERETAEGIFRLLLGFNAPEILIGDAYPNGARIAIPYEPTYTDLTGGGGGGDAPASGEAQVQQFYGLVDAETQFAYYDIYGAQAGQTLYLYTESTTIDTYLIVCDITCEEVFAENDDISDSNVNSALEYTFPESGDYSIAVTDCCSETAVGEFLILLGYNAPEVLTGQAVPNGAEIAQEYEYNRVTAGNAERTEVVNCENVELAERPTLSGAELTAETDNFVIHYTLEGDDATTEDFVQEVLDYVESTLAIQTQDFFWPAPPSDCGEGGDTRFDFYLEEILDDQGILGYAQPENNVGDNPNSSKVEEWAAYSYMTIDNDFRGSDNPLGVMRATIAHEFHHSVQFGYDIADALNWYYESTASWMETQALPQEQDATGYTESLFSLADLCIGNKVDDETGVRIYGEWLLIDSIAQDYGANAVIKLWEYVADYEGMDVFYTFLNDLGTSPQEVLARYSVRNILRSYELGDVFPSAIIVEGAINGAETIVPRFTGLQEMSADYVFIRTKGVYNFDINNPDLSLLVVGINNNQGTAQVFEVGQSGTVDTTPFSHSYVIILNNTQHDDPDNCNFTQWELTVTNGSAQTALNPTSEIFDASHFAPTG